MEALSIRAGAFMRAGHSLLIFIIAGGLLCGCSRSQLRRAQSYELSGNTAAALEIYQRLAGSTPPADVRRVSELQMRIGECLFRLGRIPEAFSAFQKAAEADAGNLFAHLRMGQLFLSAGSPDRAREQAQLVLNRSVNNADALVLLGASWSAAENTTLAKDAFTRVLQLDPSRISVAVALADIYNREDNVARAREILRDTAAAQPKSAMPWLALARLAEQEGEPSQAEESYRRAVMLEDTPDTNARLAQFLQRNARVVEAEQVLRKVDSQERSRPVALGDFKFLSGHPDSALEQYRSASLSEAPTHAIPSAWWQRIFSSTQSVEKQSGTAIALPRLIEASIADAGAKRGRDRELALHQVGSALSSQAARLDSATRAMLEAEIALAENNLTLARLLATSAQTSAPDSAAANYVLGLVEYASGNNDLARTEWETALDEDSHFVPAKLMLAEDALARNDAAAADEQVRSVVRDEPGNFRALMLFSRVLLAQGKLASAVLIANRALALNPGSYEPPLVLGEVALKLGNMPQALLQFEHAVLAEPDSEQAIDGLLRVYRRGQVSHASLNQLEHVAVQPPISSTLLEIAGRLYADHGWYNDAVRALAKAVEIDPKRTTAARSLAELQFAVGDFSQAAHSAKSVGGNPELLLRGFHEQARGNWQNAIAEYENAIRAGEHTGVAANNLAWLYAEHEAHLDRALELAGTAAKESPNNPAVLDTLGFVHLQRREYSDAVTVFETAARLSAAEHPQSHDRLVAQQIRKHLALAYMQAGLRDAAVQVTSNRGPFALR